jgi:prepilin-type N-terminal cleavage/methylation domain-containing protein
VIRRGFTMPELMLSLVISSMLLGAIASLFVLMARTLPDDTSSLSRANQLTRAVDRFSFDVSWATQIVQGSPSRCEMVIPDCTGDSVADTVIYAWAGAGSNWTRTLNAGTTETICPAIQSFTMSWRYRQVAGTPTVKTLECVQIELKSTNPRTPSVVSKISATSHAVVP